MLGFFQSHTNHLFLPTEVVSGLLAMIIGASAVSAGVAICSGVKAPTSLITHDEVQVLNQENVIGPVDPNLYLQCGRRENQSTASQADRCRKN